MNRKNTVARKIFYASAKKDGMSVECAMQWNDSYQESVQCFTNNIPQRDGGTHLTALRQVMTRTINNYIEANEVAKSQSGNRRRRYARRPDLRFVRQTARPEILIANQRDKLVSSEIGPVVNEVINQA